MAGSPLPNLDTQRVGLLLQLAHPLDLHGQVATDFRDLAFNGIRQYGGSAPPLSRPRGTYDFRFRHSNLSRPILTAASVHGCTVWNAPR